MNSFLKKTLVSFTTVLAVSASLILGFEVIQTQEHDSLDGIELDITSIAVKNNVLTIRFKFRNVGSEQQEPKLYYKDCYIMDETNQKKYFPLKDSDDSYIAGPKTRGWSGGYMEFKIDAGKSKGMWIKFPEPTDNPETIAISIPGVFPFEEVALTK